MLQYDFMRYAFIAGIFIALICGVMGVFVVAHVVWVAMIAWYGV